jgi:hypothetical protein
MNELKLNDKVIATDQHGNKSTGEYTGSFTFDGHTFYCVSFYNGDTRKFENINEIEKVN